MVRRVESFAEVVDRLRPELAGLWVGLEEGAALAVEDYQAKDWRRADHPHDFASTVRAAAHELELKDRVELGQFGLADSAMDSIELIHSDGTRILALARPQGGGLPKAKTKKRQDWYAANAMIDLFEPEPDNPKLTHLVLTYNIAADGAFSGELIAPSGGLSTYWTDALDLADLIDALPPLDSAEASIEDDQDDERDLEIGEGDAS